MAAGGVLANGTKVGFSASSPTTYTALTQVLSVDFPKSEVDPVDTTVHGSNRLKRSMPGLIGVRPMTIRTLWDPALSVSGWCKTLSDYRDDGTTLYWRVEVPRDRAQTQWTSYEFQGYVTAADPVVGAPSNRLEFEVVVNFDDSNPINVLLGSNSILQP